MTAGPDDGAAWDHLKRPGAARTGTRHRDELAQRFAAVTELRPELGRHVGASGRDLPVYRWVPYKEAYSPALVHAVLNHLGLTNGTLFDPFCGAGTSLLVAAERGLSAVGVERLPYAAYAAQTTLAAHRADRARLLEAANAVLAYRGRPRPPSPDVPAAAWAFSPEVRRALARLTSGVMRIEPGIEAELLHLALLTTVETASYSVKDGTSVRHRPPGGRPGRRGVERTEADVRTLFMDRVHRIADDLPHAPDGSNCRVVLGDARTFHAANAYEVAVFSPPYPNRYDYAAIYQLELSVGAFCDGREGLRSLRRDLLRSHLESPWPAERRVVIPALDEFLIEMYAGRRTGDTSGRALRMVAGYFEDMARVLANLRLTLRPGAAAAITVGTQAFNGELLPTDLLLAAIGEEVGLTTKAVWVARAKGVAAQQRRYETGGTRECVLLLSN
jgi:hypothetical protein